MSKPQQATATGNGRTPRKGSHAVYLVSCPGWKPQRPWSWPDSFTGGKLVAKNLTGRDALGFCRAHNKAALEASQRGETFEWAIYCRFTKARYHTPERSIFDDQPPGGAPGLGHLARTKGGVVMTSIARNRQLIPLAAEMRASGKSRQSFKVWEGGGA